MRRWVKVGASVAGGVAAVGVAAAGIGHVLWERNTGRALRQLARSVPFPVPLGEIRFSPDRIAGLPTPVKRYFAFALTPGQPLIRQARVTQRGEFLMNGAWHPFSGVEHFAVHPPGFLWDASIRMAPLLPVRVRDGYLGGEGRMHGRIAGLVPVADQSGTPEMAAAALQRYLAEAAWLPTALLPSPSLWWTPVDDSTARATLADGGTTVSVDLRFGQRGEIARVSTERYRTVNGTQVLTPWDGRFREYERVEGMMVPREGEVAWVLVEGRSPYWRGRIVDFEYEFTESPASPGNPRPELR